MNYLCSFTAVRPLSLCPSQFVRINTGQTQAAYLVHDLFFSAQFFVVVVVVFITINRSLGSNFRNEVVYSYTHVVTPY